ncbi:High affinity copper uptake protein 1 [Folsomia candida]|uniref:Copper transport protein n=1 Tax=Folsomia candida TaxID=158441 RepID=A0A226EKF1_FOLCA|nr:High affinity copper uptake protein 1 [Folsomia candida]
MSHDHHGHGHHNHAPVEIVTSSTTLSSIMDHNDMDHGSMDHSSHVGGDSAAQDGGGDHHNMMMHMFFHGGVKETILFEWWKITDVGGLIGSMIAIFFLAFFYEALKFYREHLYRHSFKTVELNTLSVPVENGSSVKETHKTVQISSIPASSRPYGTPEINPIFISQSNCACPGKRPSVETTTSNAATSSGESNVENPKNNNASSSRSTSCPRTNTTRLIPPSSYHYKVKILSCMHIGQTGLHVLQVILSYFLMLIFMTYNVWLCVAVAVGAGAGYFFFGWKKSLVVDITEHCH